MGPLAPFSMPKPPVLLADLEATVVIPSDTLGERIRKLIRFSELYWRQYQYLNAADGSIGPDYAVQICQEAPCNPAPPST